MKKNLVISTVAAIAAINPEGFTVNAANLQPVTTGYAVALKRTQNSFGAEGLAKVANPTNTWCLMTFTIGLGSMEAADMLQRPSVLSRLRPYRRRRSLRYNIGETSPMLRQNYKLQF